MKQPKSYFKGQNIVEIVIILAIIVVAGIIALTLLGFNIKDLFSSSHTKYKEFKPFEWNNPDSTNSPKFLTIKAGELNGSINKPVSKCLNGTCSIDYGTFVLNGIPENFDEFVQTGGTSGGEDKLAELLIQIADQYKDNGDTEGYEDFKKFANLVHIEADLIRIAENKIKSGASADSFMTKNVATDLSYSLPEELSTTLPGLNLDKDYQSLLQSNGNLGYAAFRNALSISTNTLENKDNNVADALVNIFSTIQNKTNKYPESLRNLAQELYLNIDDLGSKSVSHIVNSNGPKANGSILKYDPITGTVTGSESVTQGDISTFLHPQYSLKEDLTGSIICTAGKNQTTARSCH